MRSRITHLTRRINPGNTFDANFRSNACSHPALLARLLAIGARKPGSSCSASLRRGSTHTRNRRWKLPPSTRPWHSLHPQRALPASSMIRSTPLCPWTRTAGSWPAATYSITHFQQTARQVAATIDPLSPLHDPKQQTPSGRSSSRKRPRDAKAANLQPLSPPRHRLTSRTPRG